MLLLVGLLISSLKIHAQSYVILNNGVTLTTDKSGSVYDFGHFFLPYKVTGKGGQFFIMDKKLVTVDESGFLYEKNFKVSGIKGKGLNYLINDDDELVTLDAKGFYYVFNKDKKTFKKSSSFGGNYFLVNSDSRKNEFEIYTLNDKGNYFNISLPELNLANIKTFGGIYFQDQKGVVYTVNKDGFIFEKSMMQVGTISKTGGNFFIDSKGLLFTISEDGFLLLPNLPLSLNIKNITKTGSNYMIDSTGRLFIVTSKGEVVEFSPNHDLTNSKILSI